jgi:hypothetical protein
VQPENLDVLAEQLGIEIEPIGTEVSVGRFKIDILAKEPNTNEQIIIENQLERTDHTHLGQLMTYAAGLDAVTIIWIAQKFTEEHRAALDWLNRITDDTFNFFGIEIELFKIGDSKPAPLFNLVSKPNDWSKQVKKSTSNSSASKNQLAQQNYWTELKSYLEKNKSIIKMQTPPAQHWTNISIGKSDFSISATVSSKDKTIGIWLNILGSNAKENFDKLYSAGYEKSFNEVNQDLNWDRMEGRKMCAVILKTSGDFSNTDDWDNQFEWLKTNLEKCHKFFKPIIMKF